MEKLDKKQIESLLTMLSSSDKENKNLALGLIEQHDFKNNIAFMLLIKKKTALDNETWGTEAPKTTKEFVKLESVSKSFSMSKMPTYKDILNILSDCNADIEHLNIVMEDFTDFLYEQLIALGYDFIEKPDPLTFKLKKKYEPSTKSI